ncbi:MAG: beta strand repeat-containing protein, partial [Acidimicrobiales bacterium]
MVPAAGLAGLVVAALLVIPAVRANPGVLLGVFPQFPTQVTVGAANVAATIEAINGSDGAEATGPITVTDLTLIPSCGNFAANCAGGADPGVFQLGSTGTGQAGTGCAGRGFTITVIDAGTGKVRFSPTDGQPFLLGQTDITTELDRCLIAFTFSVLKVPTIDTLPGDPGVSTNQIGFISGSHSGGATGSDQGEDVTTVLGGVGPVTPTLTTQASPGVQLGLPIFDVATLANGNNPTGTVAFSLYGPNDATCSGAAIFSASTPASGNGQYQSGNFTPTQAGTYRWIASYSGDAGNNAVTSPCNAPNESVVVTGVQPVTPTLTTQASPSVALGGFVSDTATLAQGNNPSGTITFRLYGPNDATCATAAVFTNTKTVAGNGGYPSDTFTPTLAGTYRWVASYSGDAGNTAVTTTCNDPNETVTITGAPAPQLTTQASPGVSLGGPVTDTATLAGATNPTGTITFNLYGPNDATCATAAVFTNMKTVTGNGQYTSDPFTPTLAGTYRWTAVYSGDANNVPLTNPCNAANESVVVSAVGPANPTLTTQASAGVALGGQVTDTATLAGGTNPTGTIAFNLYGPNDATCAGAVAFTNTKTVTGNGQYTSNAFTPTVAGTYRWTASYSGDAGNTAVTAPCNAPNESVAVTGVGPANPTLSTQASAGVALGGAVTDTATLAGGTNPTGTITFNLFGPNDATCSTAAVFTNTKTVTGNGQYTSDPFTPTAAGTYRWAAAYSGDAGNTAVTSPCNA